jgi:hypothetical protein
VASALCPTVISMWRPILSRADNRDDNSAAELGRTDPNIGEPECVTMNTGNNSESCGRFRKPPVGSSSRPVGSEISN